MSMNANCHGKVTTDCACDWDTNCQSALQSLTKEFWFRCAFLDVLGPLQCAGLPASSCSWFVRIEAC